MDNQNLNSSYLNSDAVANQTRIADQSVGDGNNMLSVDELAQFFNQTIFTWVNLSDDCNWCGNSWWY